MQAVESNRGGVELGKNSFLNENNYIIFQKCVERGYSIFIYNQNVTEQLKEFNLKKEIAYLAGDDIWIIPVNEKLIVIAENKRTNGILTVEPYCQ